jgi:hypothetical protein
MRTQDSRDVTVGSADRKHSGKDSDDEDIG